MSNESKREPNLQFEGTFEELQRDVAGTKLSGQWERTPAGQKRFRCSNGAILNWWPSTKTLNFQGPTQAAAYFEAQLFELWRLNKVLDTTFVGDLLTLLERVHSTGVPGAWRRVKKYYWQFRTSDGATLIWSEQNGRMTFRGPTLAVATLERKLFEVDAAREDLS